MNAEWRHVADIATIQRSRLSEVRISVVQNHAGPALMLRRFVRSKHHDGMNSSPDPIVVLGDRVTEFMMAMDQGRRAIAALKEAERV